MSQRSASYSVDTFNEEFIKVLCLAVNRHVEYLTSFDPQNISFDQIKNYNLCMFRIENLVLIFCNFIPLIEELFRAKNKNNKQKDIEGVDAALTLIARWLDQMNLGSGFLKSFNQDPAPFSRLFSSLKINFVRRAELKIALVKKKYFANSKILTATRDLCNEVCRFYKLLNSEDFQRFNPLPPGEAAAKLKEHGANLSHIEETLYQQLKKTHAVKDNLKLLTNAQAVAIHEQLAGLLNALHGEFEISLPKDKATLINKIISLSYEFEAVFRKIPSQYLNSLLVQINWFGAHPHSAANEPTRELLQMYFAKLSTQLSNKKQIDIALLCHMITGFLDGSIDTAEKFSAECKKVFAIIGAADVRNALVVNACLSMLIIAVIPGEQLLHLDLLCSILELEKHLHMQATSVGDEALKISSLKVFYKMPLSY